MSELRGVGEMNHALINRISCILTHGCMKIKKFYYFCGEMPKLSIIIPAYNAAKTIELALQSILRQNMEDTEVIVVNDGSTDATLEIVNRIKAENSSPTTIRVISQENRGVSSARNVAIKEAQGRYWTTVDADDEVVDGGLQAMLAAAERDGYPEMVYSSYITCKTQQLRVENLIKDATIVGEETGLKIVQQLTFYHYITAWAKLFNREFTIKNDLWYKTEMTKNEDTEFAWRLLPKLKSATTISTPTYLYNDYNPGVTSKFSNPKEFDYLFYAHKVVLDNVSKLSTEDKVAPIRESMLELTTFVVFHLLILMYSSNYRGKRKLFKSAYSQAAALGADFNKYCRYGFPKIIARLLKTGTLLPHIAFLIVCKTPVLRKRLSC
jgi:glycosyltransferase involved in cell wall biosynthesis